MPSFHRVNDECYQRIKRLNQTFIRACHRILVIRKPEQTDHQKIIIVNSSHFAATLNDANFLIKLERSTKRKYNDELNRNRVEQLCRSGA